VQGGALQNSSQIITRASEGFLRGGNNGEISFYQLETKKKTFFYYSGSQNGG